MNDGSGSGRQLVAEWPADPGEQVWGCIMLCRYCRRKRANRPRGLCWTCYYTPGLRDLFPSTSKFARRGVGNFYGQPPLPDEPTDALPGSEEKIRVLMERAAKGQALFHPDDATLPLPSPESCLPTTMPESACLLAAS